MKQSMIRNYINKCVLGLLALFLASCDEYLDIPIPTNSIFADQVFENDATTVAAINGILANLSTEYYISELSLNTGLYTDELTLNYNSSPTYQRYYADALSPTNAPSAWSDLYPFIYQANAIIEGINASTAKLENRDQYLGEAHFLRAMFFFYLTNLYGDIALPLTSDYTVNNSLSRVPQDQVYEQIVSDLQLAASLLPEVYTDKDGNESFERARPNLSAARALLARVYLYTQNWEQAVQKATEVIAETATYTLTDLNAVFLTNSEAMIWGLVPNQNPYSFVNYVGDYYIYMGWDYGSGFEYDFPYASAYLSQNQLSAFEEGDLRFSQWTFKVALDGTDYYVPYKYQSSVTGVESFAFLRIAEQYLIRAEANAQQGKLGPANEDLSKIRMRAGLDEVSFTNKELLLAAIEKERQAEFFAEAGYRFFDLKRTGKIDAIMPEVIKEKKDVPNATWESYKKNWPIPFSEINANPNLKQTPGY